MSRLPYPDSRYWKYLSYPIAAICASNGKSNSDIVVVIVCSTDQHTSYTVMSTIEKQQHYL